MLMATFDCVTSISGASPVTLIVSATPTRASLKSIVMRGVDRQRHVLARRGREPRQVRLDVVDAGLESRQEYMPSPLVTAVRTTPVFSLSDGDGHPRQDGVARVDDPPLNVLVACAKSGTAVRSVAAARKQSPRHLRLRMSKRLIPFTSTGAKKRTSGLDARSCERCVPLPRYLVKDPGRFPLV